VRWRGGADSRHCRRDHDDRVLRRRADLTRVKRSVKQGGGYLDILVFEQLQKVLPNQLQRVFHAILPPHLRGQNLWLAPRLDERHQRGAELAAQDVAQVGALISDEVLDEREDAVDDGVVRDATDNVVEVLSGDEAAAVRGAVDGGDRWIGIFEVEKRSKRSRSFSSSNMDDSSSAG
jgi:hypothetical protein